MIKRNPLTAKVAKTTFATAFTSLQRSKKASVVEKGAKAAKKSLHRENPLRELLVALGDCFAPLAMTNPATRNQHLAPSNQHPATSNQHLLATVAVAKVASTRINTLC